MYFKNFTIDKAILFPLFVIANALIPPGVVLGYAFLIVAGIFGGIHTAKVAY